MARRIFTLDELPEVDNTETDPVKRALFDLMKAAAPFTNGDIVTETSGTIPLMESLEDAIKNAQEVL
jgi:hypothetical protein